MHTFLSKQSLPHPWLGLLKLLWPIPWKYPLPQPLLDPLDIRNNPQIVHQRYYVEDNLRSWRAMPLFKMRDTPLRSLYRLHDVLCADEQYIMLEGYYFWMQSTWRLKDIPDPQDPNPLRYAILASLVESMVQAYNWKISIGARRGLRSQPRAMDEAHRREANKPYEESSEWAVRAPGVEEWVSFLADGSMVNCYGVAFEKRRIYVNASQLENF